MAQIKKDKKVELFAQGEFKSKAEKGRFAKAEEERVIDEFYDHIKALVDAYGEPLEVGEYIKLGVLKLTKKEKDGVAFVDVKVKL
jgi:hypothetical protein